MELTRDEKLTVLDVIIGEYDNNKKYNRYLCNDIADAAIYKGFTRWNCDALELIPELLTQKPKNIEAYKGWFGKEYAEETRNLRLKALHELKKIIMSNEKQETEIPKKDE